MIAVEEVIDRFKFRVWDKYEKSYWLQSTIEQNIHWLMNPEEYKDANYPPDYVKIEQCTSIKDKKGKLVYEGDIVIKNGYKYKVAWNNILLGFYLTDNVVFTNLNNEIEIIGNINENADLLGEAK